MRRGLSVILFVLVFASASAKPNLLDDHTKHVIIKDAFLSLTGGGAWLSTPAKAKDPSNVLNQLVQFYRATSDHSVTKFVGT
jgi:hypothetical protein